MPQERYAADMRIKENALNFEADFFKHWSLMSGGTFALLVPLVQTLTKPLQAVIFLKLGEMCLIIALFASALGLYSVKRYARERNFHGDPDFSASKIIKYWTSVIVLLAYAIGVMAIAVFINLNLL